MSRTRALYVLKRYPRLSETFILREMRGLQEAGALVVVDALLEPLDEPRHPEAASLDVGVRYLPRRPALLHRPVLAAHARCALRRPATWVVLAARARADGTWPAFLRAGLVADRARRQRVSNIHAHFATGAAEVAVPAGRLARVPVTVTAHAKDVYEQNNARLLSRRLAGAAAVVTVSRYNLEHLRRVLPGTEVRLVANGVAVHPLGAPTAGGPVLCVARLVEKKGVDLLVSAFASLAASHPDLLLEVVGAGPLDENLRAQASAAGVGDRVTFRGALTSEGVADAYARCSMVVLPCRISRSGDRDGIPTVLTEAAAHGLPVVSTAVVGIGELVLDGRTGFLVPPEDAGSLAAAIAKLVDDPTLGVELGAAGRRHVHEVYSPADATTALLAVLEEVRCASR